MITVLLLLAACDPGDVVLLAPDGSGSEAPSTSIRAVVDTPYAALTAALGWEGGVPGTQVRVHRMEEPHDESYWTGATTDSAGMATFADLLAGLYEVTATRALTVAETAQAQGAVRLVAGGRRIFLPSAQVHDVTLAPDGRGSLVFSEFSLAVPSHWETGGLEYHGHKYFEVYNNVDTTIYLDGKYWGAGWDLNRDYPYLPCAQTVVVRNDPEGIWTQRVFRFPGGGTDYSLGPGEVALVAKSAIDHRAVHPGLDDLSRADLEWGGSRDADNPDVANLEEISLRPAPPNWPAGADMPVFLSEPVDLASLPQYVDPYSGRTWVRIPGELILDVWVGVGDQSLGQYTYLSCLEVLHRYFERLPGPAYALGDFSEALSVQRRGLTVLPDGRKVLQDVNTSMLDFVKAVRTPGWIPF